MSKDALPLGKKSNAKCKVCKALLIQETGKYCQCWEKKLRGFRSKKSLRASLGGALVETWFVDFPWPDGELSVAEIEDRLLKAGLKQHEVDLLIEKVVDEKPWSQVTKDQGWTSEGSARHFMRETLKFLRKARFRP